VAQIGVFEHSAVLNTEIRRPISMSQASQSARVHRVADKERARIVGEVRVRSERFFEWQSVRPFKRLVDEIQGLVDELDEHVGRARHHRERVFKPWREAWVLQHLFPVFGATAARLVDSVDGHRPDAQLRLRGKVLPVEVTEALASSYVPQDRPSLEPRFDGDVRQWRRNADEVAGLLDSAAKRKIEKPYSGEAVLVVYLGTGATYGIADNEIRSDIVDFRHRYGAAFQGIHVLWGQTVY
jgi:hypothetical protein